MKKLLSVVLSIMIFITTAIGMGIVSSAEENSVKVNVNVDFSSIGSSELIEDRVEAYFYWSDSPIAFYFRNGIVPEGWNMTVANTSIADTLLCAEGDIHPANTDEYYLVIVAFGHSSHEKYKNAVAYYGYDTFDIAEIKADRGALYSEPEDILIETDPDNPEDEYGNWTYNILSKDRTIPLTAVSGDELLGTVSGSDDYLIGTEATLTAEPFSGAGFSGWYDSKNKLVGTDTELHLIAGRAAEYTAKFECTNGLVAPEAESLSSTHIRVKPTDGQIYSIDNGETWIDPAIEGECVFHALDRNTEYKILTKKSDEDAMICSLIKTNLHDFKDLPAGKWFTEASEWCFERGYMTGTGDDTFDPNIQLTRAMYIQILAKVAGADLDSYTPSGKFKDVPANAWYAKAVEWAYQNDVTGGTSDDTFSPNDPVTREQLATFFFAYAKKIGLDTSGSDDLKRFKDRDQISSWALDGMKYAVANKLISGTSDTTLEPKTIATRGQVAVIFKAFVTAQETPSDPS